MSETVVGAYAASLGYLLGKTPVFMKYERSVNACLMRFCPMVPLLSFGGGSTGHAVEKLLWEPGITYA